MKCTEDKETNVGLRTHVGLEPGGVLQDLRLQVPRLGRPRPLDDGERQPVIRVVTPVLRAELREVGRVEVGSPEHLLGRRGVRRARGRLIPGKGFSTSFSVIKIVLCRVIQSKTCGFLMEHPVLSIENATY